MAKELINEFDNDFWDTTLNKGKGGLTTIGQYLLIFVSIQIFSTFFRLVLNKKEK